LEILMADSPVAVATLKVLSSTLGLALDPAAPISRETVAAWDSIKHVDLIFALEDEFGVQFSEAEMAELTDYRQIVASVERKLGGQ
jgi:acyl carrier protein